MDLRNVLPKYSIFHLVHPVHAVHKVYGKLHIMFATNMCSHIYLTLQCQITMRVQVGSHLLTDMLLSHYHKLSRPINCYGWFCQFSFVESITWFTLFPWLGSTTFGSWSCQCSLSNFNPVFLHVLQCSWSHSPYCHYMYCSFANIGHADIQGVFKKRLNFYYKDFIPHFTAL